MVTPTLIAGKHLIVEKSLASSIESAESMVNESIAQDRLLAENFMFQYHRQMAFVHDLLSQGKIGEVRQVRSSFGFPPLPLENFRYSSELGGGALLDAGAYTLKAAQVFLGRELSVESAVLIDSLNCGVDTLGAAHLTNAHGISALVGFGFDQAYQCNLRFGERKVPFRRIERHCKPDFSPEIIVETQGSRETHLIDPDDQFGNFLTGICDAIDQKAHQPFRDEALAQARLISAVKELANV